METKNIIIGGLALAVIGGGAYWFVKNKRLKDASKLAELEKLGQGVNIGVATAGSSTTPDKVLDSAPVNNQTSQAETTKQIQAQALATQIWTLKSEFASLQGLIPTCTMPMFGQGSASEYEKCSTNKTQIIGIQRRIKDLGYREDNGLAVKI
jgi:hypothetical protein